jgi:hypothetical protein
MFVAVLGLASLPAIALAGTQGSCPSSDTSKVRLWENTTTDSSDGNDSLWKCGNDNDLSNDTHTLPGDCKSNLANQPNWNDCVSSVSVWVPSGWCVNFYRSAGYDNLMPNSTVQGPSTGVRFNLQYNDALSSFLSYEC